MNRVDQLTQQLCPGGVPYRLLSEIGETVSGLTGKTKADFSDGNARYVSYMNAFTNLSVDQTAADLVKIKPGERQNQLLKGDVIFTGSSESREEVGMSSVVTGDPIDPLYLNSFCFAVRFSDATLFDPEFTKHLFRSKQIRKAIEGSASGVTRINISKQRFMKVRVPCPPLELQREVAGILDTFSKLEAELEAELEARQMQYKHYRADLMSFQPAVKFEKLGVLFANLDSKRRPVTRSSRVSGQFPYYGANGIQDFVDDFLFDGTFLLMGEDGSVMQKDRTPVVNWAEGKIWVNNHAHVLVEKTSEVSLRFLFHYLQTLDISTFITGGTQPKLNQARMNEILIPIVPRVEQEQIVSLLDKFDALVNDLNSGLPAELTARRQQYEHYRDRLLTFQEATV